MKDHEIRELVNELTQVARDYGQTQQLRDRIAGIIVHHLKQVPEAEFATQVKHAITLMDTTQYSVKFEDLPKAVQDDANMSSAWGNNMAISDAVADEVCRRRAEGRKLLCELLKL